MRSYQCADCGTQVRRKRHSTDPKVCINCGVNRLILNSLLMQMHTGSGYSKWQESAGPNGRPRKN